MGYQTTGKIISARYHIDMFSHASVMLDENNTDVWRVIYDPEHPYDARFSKWKLSQTSKRDPVTHKKLKRYLSQEQMAQYLTDMWAKHYPIAIYIDGHIVPKILQLAKQEIPVVFDVSWDERNQTPDTAHDTNSTEDTDDTDGADDTDDTDMNDTTF